MFFIFLQQNLSQAYKNLGRLLQNILFFLIVCAVFFMLMQDQLGRASEAFCGGVSVGILGQATGGAQAPVAAQGQTPAVAPAGASQQFLMGNIVWLALLFSLIFANGDFLAADYRDGTVEQMTLLCPNLETFILSKIIASWLIFCSPILFVVPFIMAAIGADYTFTGHFTILLILASFAINFVCAFCGSLNIAGNQASLLAILALPLIIPILLIACAGFTGGSLSGNADNFYFSLKLLIGICAFVGSTLLIATTKIVKITGE